ncbi:MAG TPA: hypothetical protein VIL61_00405 [Nitrospiria bacterium]
MSRLKQKRIPRSILLVLSLYILLFSGFAEFHAYANNELGETTCTIGLWVQHGQAAVLAVVLISTALASLHSSNPFIKTFEIKPFRFTVSLRAPPLPPLL